VASPFPGSSYLVLRSRTQFPLASSQSADQMVVFGRIVNVDGDYGKMQSDAIGWVVASTGSPPQVGAWEYDSMMSAYSTGQLNVALHAMTVVVTCLGPAQSVAGACIIGSFPARVGRDLFTTNYNNLANTMTNTDLARRHSFYSIMTKPVAISATPMDLLSWDTLLPLHVYSLGTGAQTPTTVKMEDSLTPIFVLVPADQNNAGSVQITVHCEWRIIGNSSSLYRNLHRHYQPAPMGAWSSITSAGQAVGGFIHGAGDAALAFGRGAYGLAQGLGALREQLAGQPGFQAIALAE